MSNAGQSHVGYPALYEAQDQRNFKQSEVEEQRRHTGENVQGFLPSTRPPPGYFCIRRSGVDIGLKRISGMR